MGRGRALLGDQQNVVKGVPMESAHDAEIVGHGFASSLPEGVEQPVSGGGDNLLSGRLLRLVLRLK